MQTSALQKTIYGLVATAITFTLAVLANAFLAYRLNDAKIWTLHTHQVIEQLKDALGVLQELESDDRAYAISRNPIFSRNYREQRFAFLAHLERLNELVADNPSQVSLLQKARNFANAKLAFIDEVFQSTDSKTAGILINSGRGRAYMYGFKNQINAMIDNEDRLLAARNADLLNLQRLNWFATAFLAVFSIFLLVWVFRITRQAIGEEQKKVVVLQAEVEERRKVENDLLLTAQKLASSNTDLQQFAYVASHDLQEPLRAVAGFLTLIVSKNKGKLDPETEVWINHAVEGAQRMRTLINDLLSYARVDSQGKALSPVDCNRALQLAKNDLSVLIDEAKCRIDSDHLPTVLGDEGQLAQVFQNLIANAIKFRSGENPHLVIRVEEKHSEWTFSVQDNGIGFEEEHAKRIFVIFQRLHGRDEYKGTGIGLAICKKIVGRHGGRIWARSQPASEAGAGPAKGSTFYFTIPVIGAPGGHIEHLAQSSDKGQSAQDPPY